MKKLVIVQMNDTHAYLEPHPELFWEQGRSVYRTAGGYAKIASILKQIRAENPGQVALFDGGDTFHGTHPAIQTKGEALVPVLNALHPAAMTAHWEFAYTPQGFKKLTGQLTYPMLAMNVYEKESGKLFFKSYEVVEVAGLRLGIAGIASNIVDKTMPHQFSEGLHFTNGSEELPGVIRTLRQQEKVDVVILVSHLGFPQDMQLMEQVPGVDVCLSAHTHHRLEQAVRQGTSLVVQSGSHGSFITRLDLNIEGCKIVDFTHQLIEINETLQPDPGLNEIIQNGLRPYREELDQVVGRTLAPLNRGFNLESTMDNFILSSLLDRTGAQVAFSNGWRYGAPIVPGPIYLNDLYNMVPMNPPVSTVDITGEEMVTMLEENLEHTFSRDPWQQMGGYLKRSLGIRTFFKIENPPHQRIHKLFIGDTEVELGKMYKATFITEQGVPAKYGQNRQEHPEKTIDVMCEYLKKNPVIDIRTQGTFTLI